MDEFIKRETLLQEVAMQKAASKASYPRRSFVVGDVISCIRAAPASDVVPLVHGHWFFTEYEFFTCSVCGGTYYTGAESTDQAKSYLNSGNVHKYCPSCGAKVDGGENNENKS